MPSGDLRVCNKLTRFGVASRLYDGFGELVAKLVHVLYVNFFLLEAPGQEYILLGDADVVDQRGNFHVKGGVGQLGTDFELVDLPDFLIKLRRAVGKLNVFTVLLNFVVVAEGLVDLHCHSIRDIVKLGFMKNHGILALTEGICLRTQGSHNVVDNYRFIRIFYFISEI